MKLYGTASRELTVETERSSSSKASSVEAWPKQHLLESWLGCKGTTRIPDGVHCAPGNEGLLLLGVAVLRVGGHPEVHGTEQLPGSERWCGSGIGF